MVGREGEYWRDGPGRRVRSLPAPEVMEATQPWLAGLAPATRPPSTYGVLASAHLDHDPGHILTALGQRCYMLHGTPEHRPARWRKRFARRAMADLFSTSEQG